MNKIIITREQLVGISNWANSNKRKIEDTFYPYLLEGQLECYDWFVAEFEITLDSDRPIIHFNIDYKIWSTRLDVVVEEVGFTIKDGYYSLPDNRLDNTKLDMELFYEEKEKTVKEGISYFFAVNAYFFHYKQDVESLPVKVVKRSLVKGKCGVYKYNTVKSLARHYIIKEPIRTEILPKGKQWHKDCWGVVGHIRVLKSGIKVYVKPYKKGKSRNALEVEKIYKID